MKRRWRILKGGMRFKVSDNKKGYAKVVQEMDNVVRVCALMHNMILEHTDQHTIGEREGDWIFADLDMDEARIAAQQQARQGQQVPNHNPNPNPIPNQEPPP